MSDFSQGPGWWQASDGKWYPPQTAAQQYPQAQQPNIKVKSGGKGLLIGLGLFLFLMIGSCGVLAVVAGNTAEETGEAINAAVDEAEKEAEKATDEAEKGDPNKSGEVRSSSGNTSNPPENDVTVTKCAKGQFTPEIQVTIKNNSSKRSNYMVNISLVDEAGTKMGEGFTAENNVDPGQSAISDVLATESAETWTQCKIVEVQRFAASGT